MMNYYGETKIFWKFSLFLCGRLTRLSINERNRANCVMFKRALNSACVHQCIDL